MKFRSNRLLFIRWRRLGGDILLSGLAFFATIIVPMVAQFGLKLLYQSREIAMGMALYMAASALAFIATGTYRVIWRYVSFRDILKIIYSVTLGLAIFFMIVFLWKRPVAAIPGVLLAWSVTLLGAVTVAFVTAPRLIARLLGERNRFIGPNIWHARDDGIHPSVLLVGKPERMDTFIRECQRNPKCAYHIIGAFADDERLRGSYLNGVKIFGRPEEISSVLCELHRHGIDAAYLVLADDEAKRTELERLLDLVTGTDIQIRRLPPMGAFEGEVPLRPIVLSDLLGRPEISLDNTGIAAMIEGKCIMVTGAGGSIGSELCRQILAFKPAKIVLLDSCEFNLYSIDHELQCAHPSLDRVAALADVRDGPLIAQWIEAAQPEVVFHAAALKHVPLLENLPIEAVKTNVFGTINVAEACRASGVKAVVAISTDKAVNPFNVMGASKRLAEAYCQDLDQAIDGGTRFMTVRFGNVLGSAGSVVPLFQHQIEMGGPVTVTHPDIVRYFMTIPEAVTLVLHAGAQGIDRDNERGSVYVLDMGQPVKIIDLARQMIRLSGYRPEVDIKIDIVGLRPGEKLYEEIFHDEESVDSTSVKSIFKVRPRITEKRILRLQLQELRNACADGDQERVLRLLKLSVPEFGQVPAPKAVLPAGYGSVLRR